MHSEHCRFMQRITYQQLKYTPRALTLNFSALSAQIWANDVRKERSRPLSGKLFGGSGLGAVAGGEGALELAGVLEVVAVGYCETVGSVKFLACAEVDVAMLVWIQDCIQAGFRRHIDRSRRKPNILIGVVRGIYSKMFLEDSVQSIVKTESYRRVCL